MLRWFDTHPAGPADKPLKIKTTFYSAFSRVAPDVVMTAAALVVGFWSLVIAGRLLLWVIRTVVTVVW